MNAHEFKRQFDVEARRLRLNMFRITGLAGNDSSWQVELLERMRALKPGASWADVFPGDQLPEPDPELAELLAAAELDPDAYWREREQQQELFKEFQRVVPMPRNDADSPAGLGFSLPHGIEHALRVLRRLPDSAGAKVFHDLLHRTPADV